MEFLPDDGHAVTREFSRVSLPWHSSVLHQAISHTSGRTTSQGADQYIRNFVYAFQKSFLQNYRHHLEIYRVEPYSVFWNYADYLGALSAHELPSVELYPYSLALRAGRGRRQECTVIQISSEATVGILGDDWLGHWFAEHFAHRKKTVIRSVSDARQFDVIVLAYDYSMGRPYGEIADDLTEIGFELGRSLFLYQMLIR